VIGLRPLRRHNSYFAFAIQSLFVGLEKLTGVMRNMTTPDNLILRIGKSSYLSNGKKEKNI